MNRKKLLFWISMLNMAILFGITTNYAVALESISSDDSSHYVACNADFTYETIDPDSGLVLLSANNGSEVDRFYWLIDGVQYHDQEILQYTFDFSGDTLPQACLYAFAGDYCESVTCQEIILDYWSDSNYYAECEAWFGYNVMDSQAGLVEFYNESYSIDEVDSLYWMINGTKIYNEDYIQYTFDFETDSLPEVCLYAFAGTCQSEACQYIYIEDDSIAEYCDADFYWEPITSHQIQFYTINADPLLAHHWFFGDGTESNELNPIHTFGDSLYETYVTLVVTSSQCSAEATNLVGLYDDWNDTIFDCNSEIVINHLEGDLVFIEAIVPESVDSVYWKVGDSLVFDQYYLELEHNVEEDGILEVCLYTFGEACESINCVYLGDNYPPYEEVCNPDFYYYPSEDEGFLFFYSLIPEEDQGNYRFNWKIGDSTIATTPEMTFFVDENDPSTHLICLEISNDSCMAEMCQLVYFEEYDCQASFTYSSYETDDCENCVLFEAETSNDIADYFWEFGDGTFDVGQTVVKDLDNFNGMSAVVCLSIYTHSGCTDMYCSTIDIEEMNFSISGNIYLSEGTLDDGFVLLYKQEDDGFVASDATVVNDGLYAFSNIEEGEYILQAMPNYTNGTYLYFPTFYVDALTWEGADIISVNESITGVDIQLIGLGSFITGPCSISGIVSKHKSSNIIGGTPVLLFDENGNELVYAMADASGTFKVDNIDYGTYYLLPQIPNIPDAAKVKVELTPENYSISGIEFNINNVLSENSSFEDEFVLQYINDGMVEILANEMDLKLLNVEIYNSIGQKFDDEIQKNINSKSIMLNTSNLMHGVYFIKLTNKLSNHVFTTKVIR
jgi:hypothetical protein